MNLTLHPGPRTAVWAELAAHATRLAAVPVRELFERDPGALRALLARAGRAVHGFLAPASG